MSPLNYKGYVGAIDCLPGDKAIHGQVIGMESQANRTDPVVTGRMPLQAPDYVGIGLEDHIPGLIIGTAYKSPCQ